MQKTGQINGKICKILNVKTCKSNFNSSNFYCMIKLDDSNKYFCYLSHEPYEGDLITGTIDYSKSRTSKFDNEEEYNLTKPKVLLPTKKEEQIKRIINLLENHNETIFAKEEIEQKFKNYHYGKDFWFHIYKQYLDENIIDGVKIQNYLKIIAEHISKYTFDMLKNFKDLLESKGVNKLTQKQLLELYIHPKFGFNIDTWEFSSVFKLFNVEGFGISTLIKISKAINATLDEISQLIIMYSLEFNHKGNTYITYDYHKWTKEILKDKQIVEMFTDELFNNLTENKFCEIINTLLEQKKVVKIDNILYGKKVYDCEQNIAWVLNETNNNPSIIAKYNLSEKEIKQEINKNPKQKNKIELNQEQKDGIFQIFNNNVSVIYGKAGTGKTSLLGKFVEIFKYVFSEYENPVSLWFLAPTGKAKIKIEDNLCQKFSDKFYYQFDTIHAFNFKNSKNKKINVETDSLNLTDFDHNIFIIDESSMVDIYLLDNFLKIVNGLNCTIVLLGDNRQLPSVGPGCILDKLIDSNVFKITELNQVVRNGGNITNILDKVINGTEITLNDCDDKNQFKWLIPSNENEHELVLNILEKNKTNTIITTTNNLIEQMTNDIREIKNPQNKQKSINEYIKSQIQGNKKNKTIFRVGDPVMHCKNNNVLKLANGTQGEVSNILFDENDKVKCIQVKYKKTHKHHVTDNIEQKENNKTTEFIDKDYRIINYDINKEIINDLEPAYMITAHKSQGQEYPNIVVVLKKSILLNRNILYTAMSRAQKSITLVSTEENLKTCLKKKSNRNSLLDHMIKYYASDDIIEFSDYYLKQICDNLLNNSLDENYEEIMYNGQYYVFNINTFEVFDYSNQTIGESYGIYNKTTNKIKKHKNKVKQSNQIEIEV